MTASARVIPILLITLACGCSSPRDAVPLSVGSYAFVSGEFTATAAGTLEDLAERATKALQNRATDVVTRRRGQPGGGAARVDIRGRLPDARDASIRLAPIPESDRIRVSIRIGPLGDEAESARLLEAIRAAP